MASHRENPFNGLRAFDYAQRARFFGRERQSYALCRLTAFGFIAVIGNSGSGKSSLVRAGLLPLLFDAQEQQPWRVAVMTPGGSPLERLASAIATLAPEREDNDAHAVRNEHVAYLIERSSNGIADALDEMPELAGTSVLLVVDQFEEIFRIAAAVREETAQFSPDGDHIAARIASRELWVHDLRNHDRLVYAKPLRHTSSYQFSADGKRIAVGGINGTITLLDAENGKTILAFHASDNTISDVRFSPDGRLIASASNGPANSLSFSFDGRRLLIGADDGAQVWDYATGRTEYVLRGYAGAIDEAEFVANDTRVATIGADDTLRLWTVPSLPVCQQAVDRARALVPHQLTPALRAAEFITPRHSPSILNAFLRSQSCS